MKHFEILIALGNKLQKRKAEVGSENFEGMGLDEEIDMLLAVSAWVFRSMEETGKSENDEPIFVSLEPYGLSQEVLDNEVYPLVQKYQSFEQS